MAYNYGNYNLSPVGSGGFGQVYLALKDNDNKAYILKALKVFHKNFHSEEIKKIEEAIGKFNDGEISDFYLDYISELLSFRLDEESDMIKKYAVALFDKVFADHKKLASGTTELEYKEILNRNNVITEFTIVVDDYFHRQLPNLLHSMAVAKIKSVQKMIENKE